MLNICYYEIITLIFYKLKIFVRELNYTIIAPLISATIFVIIFKAINEFYNFSNNQENFMNFLIPGIIIMIIIQETYSNISETLINMKQIGSFNDLLLSPMSRGEICISFIISSIIIGIFLSLTLTFILYIFNDFHLFNLTRYLYYLIITSLIFASIGSLIGFISFTWDFQQGFFNFLITPISFFSGTFFPITLIDESWRTYFYYNPFYQIVSNFRKSFFENQNYFFINDLLILFISFVFIYITLFVFKKGFKVIN